VILDRLENNAECLRRGEGGPLRTVGVPVWVKQGVNARMAAGRMENAWVLRAAGKGGKFLGED